MREHTGVIQATMVTCQAADDDVKMILDAVKQVGGICVVTADHGKTEYMIKRDKSGKPLLDKGGNIQRLTLYTLQTVPIAIAGPGLPSGVRVRKNVRDGGLAHVAAIVMDLLGFEAPSDYESILIEVQGLGDGIAIPMLSVNSEANREAEEKKDGTNKGHQLAATISEDVAKEPLVNGKGLKMLCSTLFWFSRPRPPEVKSFFINLEDKVSFHGVGIDKNAVAEVVVGTTFPILLQRKSRLSKVVDQTPLQGTRSSARERRQPQPFRAYVS